MADLFAAESESLNNQWDEVKIKLLCLFCKKQLGQYEVNCSGEKNGTAKSKILNGEVI